MRQHHPGAVCDVPRARAIVSQSPPANPQSRETSRTIFRTGSELVRVVRVTEIGGPDVTQTCGPRGAARGRRRRAPDRALSAHRSAARSIATEAAQRRSAPSLDQSGRAARPHLRAGLRRSPHPPSGHGEKARRTGERFLDPHVRAGDRVASTHCQALDRRSPSQQTRPRAPRAAVDPRRRRREQQRPPRVGNTMGTFKRTRSLGATK